MIDRLQHAWSAFRSVNYKTTPFTGGSIYPGHKMRVGSYSRSKFAGALFNRIALDVAMTEFQHVKVDEKTDDHEPMPKSGLTKMFSVEANIDQTSRAFMQDLVDRKSTRLNSSHVSRSYAVFCLKKKKIER